MTNLASDHRATRIATLIASLSLGLASCSGSGKAPAEPEAPPQTPEGFAFATHEEVLVDVRVTASGVPVHGAMVSLCDHLGAVAASSDDSSELATSPMFAAGTDPQGRIRQTIRIPAGVAEVDVVVNYPGHTGIYTVEALRNHWGPFAPSARVRADVADVVRLAIDLQGI